MAFLYVNEFANIGTPGLNIAQTPPWPPTQSYQIGVTTTPTTASVGMAATTKLVELTSDTTLSFNMGPSSGVSATVSIISLNRMPANQTRYYVVPANSNWWITAIANS